MQHCWQRSSIDKWENLTRCDSHIIIIIVIIILSLEWTKRGKKRTTAATRTNVAHYILQVFFKWTLRASFVVPFIITGARFFCVCCIKSHSTSVGSVRCNCVLSQHCLRFNWTLKRFTKAARSNETRRGQQRENATKSIPLLKYEKRETKKKRDLLIGIRGLVVKLINLS